MVNDVLQFIDDRKFRIGLHVIFWLVILFWTSTVYDYDGKYALTFIFFNAVRLPLIMGATYLILYVLIPQYLILNKEYIKFSLYFLITLVTVTFLDRLLIGSPMVMTQLEPLGLKYRFINEIPMLRNAFLLVAIIGLASMIRFFKLYLNQERIQFQIQEEKLATELSYLKAQINPHFLFNALNNLYSIAVDTKQQEMVEGLENLSQVMKYLTYDSNAEKVSLSKEIKLLQNYIEIENLRMDKSDDFTLSFNIKGEVEGHEIAPVLLLPLLENAFKHGVHPQKKSLIGIVLEVKESTLQFTIKNTIHRSRSTQLIGEGIGLQNVQKRLNLLYPKQHSISSSEKKNLFITTLKVNLDGYRT